MIDTDKYEGHTPAPWTLEHLEDDEGQQWFEIPAVHYTTKQSGDGSQQEYADAQLIADAPLLLPEVERHRPPKVDGKYMAWSDSHPKYDRRTWIEQVMEGITDVGYWTWVNWQLQYGEEGE